MFYPVGGSLRVDAALELSLGIIKELKKLKVRLWRVYGGIVRRLIKV